MKKDFFNGNIKPQYLSYMWTSIITITVVFFGCSGLFLFLCFNGNADANTRLFLLVLAVALILIGVGYLLGSLWVIRTYPKCKKIAKCFFNSDRYFANSDSDEFRGHWRGKIAYDLVVQAAEQNEGLENIKYPRKYKIYIILTIICLVLSFIYLAVACIVVKNIDVLPTIMQNEHGIIAVFVIVEALNFILSLIFAFRVKKIREITIKEFREKQYMRNEIKK